MDGTRLRTHFYSWLCVLLAAVFYANFRTSTLLAQYLSFLHINELNALQLPLFLKLHLPSFLQAALIGYLALYLTKLPSKKSLYASIASLITASALECLQLTSLLPGTFDPLDLFAIICASLMIFFSTKKQPITNISKHQKILVSGLFINTLLISMGCIEDDLKCDPDYQTCVEPITLTWEDLRADIQPSYGNTVTLTSAGKIHVKDDYLFVIDNYRGVHIFDQTDNQNPIRLAFIPMQGALDISTQGEFIYVNSFTDLVIVNYQAVINGSFEQSNVTRKEDVFEIPSFSSFFPKNYAIHGDSSDYHDFLTGGYLDAEHRPDSGFIIGFFDQDGTPVLYGEYDQSIIDQQLGDTQ